MVRISGGDLAAAPGEGSATTTHSTDGGAGRFRDGAMSFNRAGFVNGTTRSSMRLLTVRHVTTYRYSKPVGLGEHRMMFRPS